MTVATSAPVNVVAVEFRSVGGLEVHRNDGRPHTGAINQHPEWLGPPVSGGGAWSSSALDSLQFRARRRRRRRRLRPPRRNLFLFLLLRNIFNGRQRIVGLGRLGQPEIVARFLSLLLVIVV